MSATTMTMEEVRTAGLEALKRELGLVGMIRFLQQFETGQGNYTEDRHQWLDNLDIDTIVAEIKAQREG